jgi:alpha,alpha-trehalase
VSYSNFIPLLQNLAPQEFGENMIRIYLWNNTHMLSDFGLRSLSKQDENYNNRNIIMPYSNWQGPVWPIANFLYSIILKNYGFTGEADKLAVMVGELCLKDLKQCGSMHENYNAETGEPLAPSVEHSHDGKFRGFIGWNLLVQNMLEGAVSGKWTMLSL